MERRTVGKPYWKAIENFPRHKEVIDRLSRKYDAVLARYPYKSGKYQLEEDFFAELILQCREAESCSGGSFLERDCRAIDADLHERMLQARKLYNPYRNLYLDKCYGESKTPLGAWMDFSKYEEEQSGSLHMGAPVCNCVKISQNLPASHNFHFPAKNRRDNLSNWRNFIYESNRNCAPHRRPRSRRYSQGNPKNHAYPRGRPVTDDIVTVGEILLRHAGSVKKMGTGLYIVTEDEGATTSIREGWNGRKRLAARCSRVEKAGAT